jgi:hypothetical protein
MSGNYGRSVSGLSALIDVATGEVLLDTGIRIGPAWTRARFLASELHQAEAPLVGGGQWMSYDLSGRVGDRPFAITLRFDGEPLAMMSLSLLDPADAGKALHDRWLKQQLGAGPYHYSWGKIESTYDPRSLSSGIHFNYVR